MKKLVLLPFIIILSVTIHAQDKIISINHDTIQCLILSINNDRILYELKNKDGSVIGKFLPLSQVSEYSRAQLLEKKTKLLNVETAKFKYIPEYNFQLGLNIGHSKMPWYFDNYNSSSAMPDYYNKLKTGFHLNANAYYMFKSFFGFGLEYSFLQTKSSGYSLKGYSSSIYITEYEKICQYINYLGASVLFQQHLDVNRKFILSESLSAGFLFIHLENQTTSPYITYSDYKDYRNNSLLTGNKFSGKFGLTAEYKILKNLAIGLGCDFIWGTLKKASFDSRGTNNYNYSINKQELANSIKLSRFDYSFVFHYYFNPTIK